MNLRKIMFTAATTVLIAPTANATIPERENAGDPHVGTMDMNGINLVPPASPRPMPRPASLGKK